MDDLGGFPPIFGNTHIGSCSYWHLTLPHLIGVAETSLISTWTGLCDFAMGAWVSHMLHVWKIYLDLPEIYAKFMEQLDMIGYGILKIQSGTFVPPPPQRKPIQ